MLKTIIKNDVDHLDYRKGKAGTVEIFDIVVNSERCVGIGRSMIEEMIEKTKAKRVYAFCRDFNKPAHIFYEKVGFIGYELPNFYEDGNAMIFIYETSK